jgi:hypothetical protein
MSFLKSIFERKNDDNSNITIGQPTDFKHQIQVTYDKEKNEFVGLPTAWRELLEKNNIKYIGI